MKYSGSKRDLVDVYGSDDLGELFKRDQTAFWGEKPKVK